jgi:hypothetical protein
MHTVHSEIILDQAVLPGNTLHKLLRVIPGGLTLNRAGFIDYPLPGNDAAFSCGPLARMAAAASRSEREITSHDP